MKNQPNDMGKNISIINKNFKIYLKARLSDTDLTPTDFMIILTVYGSEGITQEGIIDQLGYDKAVIARRIKALVQCGHLTKIKSKEDLRAYNIFLTSKGRELEPLIFKELRRWYRALTDGISDDVIEILIKNINKMASNSIEYASVAKKRRTE